MTTISTDLAYEQFVVVAENELKFEYGKFSLKMGFIGWNVKYLDNYTNKVELSCQNVTEGTVDEVHAELVGYQRKDSNESYEQKVGVRHFFTPSTNLLSFLLNERDKILTIRILKDISLFPDFTLESTVVGGRWASDVKLRVGDQLFHVNKQLLSMHSDHFDRMFNGPYKEANQEEVELKHEPANPAAFHDFLLMMCVNETLPNPENVAVLSALANIYQTVNVRLKCQLHLSMCREIPTEERYMLAGELGFKELQTSIMRNMANLAEAERIITAMAKMTFAP